MKEKEQHISAYCNQCGEMLVVADIAEDAVIHIDPCPHCTQVGEGYVNRLWTHYKEYKTTI